MHGSDGFPYELPDLADPRLWIVRAVMVRDDGVPVKATLGRLTSEAFLLEDHGELEDGPMRMRRSLALTERACEEGRRMGIDSVHAWLVPEIAEKFGGQLARMGWIRHEWPTYVKLV